MLLKVLVIFVTLCVTSLSHAFAPQAGTWIVASEIDGKPGRGMAIDVQNNTLVMQVYAYESSGQPSFYLAVGTMNNNQTTAPLTRYTGGRFFGSGPQSGRVDSSPGNVALRFTSGIAGYVTFPGESEQMIVRYNFAYPNTAASLQGVWSFTGLTSRGIYSYAVNLSTLGAGTSTGNGLMMSSDRTFGCENQISGSFVGGIICVQVTASGALDKGFLFVNSINEGEGLMGFGSAIPDQPLSVRRLTTPSGQGTGIALKSEVASPIDPLYVQRHIEAIAKSGL